MNTRYKGERSSTVSHAYDSVTLARTLEELTLRENLYVPSPRKTKQRSPPIVSEEIGTKGLLTFSDTPETAENRLP